MTRDVSVSGLFLVTEERLTVGDRLPFTLTVPDHESPVPLQLKLAGRVVRVENAPGAVGAAIAIDEGGRCLVQAS